MQFGLWMGRIRIAAVHEDGFHQAKPPEYHPTTLAHNTAVSFHKFIRKGDTVDVERTVSEYYEAHLASKATSGDKKDEL